jgi:DNA-binding protein H-NS
MDHLQASAEEIQAQLERLAEERERLSRALQDRRKAEKKDLAAELKQLIIERGHDVAEIAELIGDGQKKRRRASSGASGRGSYTRYADPDNPDLVYVRGRLPSWLSEKMSANGFDPGSPEDRQQFKERYLVEIAA